MHFVRVNPFIFILPDLPKEDMARLQCDKTQHNLKSLACA